jgi:pilus assembly protein CpaD
MSNWTHSLRMTALAATLLAGSCASDDKDDIKLSPDGAANHPIMVEPSNMSLRLPFSAGEAGLLPEDAARFQGFVSAYLNDGTGAISISAPDGPDSRAAITYFAERLAQMGVPRARILVGTRDVTNADSRVELDFITYAARTEKCGDWSTNLADTAQNDTAPDFGCSVQQNIAAMVTNPRDLLGPEGQEPADATRRAAAFDNYEKGNVTAATKSKDQTGAVSDVGTGGSGQ